MKKLRLIAALITIVTASHSFAGFGDPWFLAYRVSGGTLTQYLGPYDSKLDCQSSKLTDLPMFAKYLGCYQ